MAHLEQKVLRSILSGEGGPQETEEATEHIVSCAQCRAQAGTLLGDLRTTKPGLRGTGPLQLVFDLIDREHQRGMDALAAIAEWAEVRKLSSRRSQRDRVRMNKACHTLEFYKLALGELKEEPPGEETEFLAGLALLSIEAMEQRQQITSARSHDLQAEIWTAVANSRRLAAEWKRAHQALDHAERHRKQGTGDSRLEAGFLSIAASTLGEEGQESQALNALEKCIAIYEGLSEWPLVARTLIKLANTVVETEPTSSLLALERAAPLIPAENSDLKLISELLRVRCLIELNRPTEALQVYRRCFLQLMTNSKLRLRIRGRFTGAQLMDALGLKQQAERLFDEVVDRDIEHELYKDAFLDLLYLYGRHVKSGDPEKAARVCRRALTDSTLAAIAHDQMRDLWTDLLEAAQRQAISQDVLRDLRQYLSVHWKHPAAIPPVVRGR